MFYSIILIVFGVYIGQEYTNVPSVKSFVNSVTASFTNSENTNSFTNSWIETVRKLLKKD